MTQNAPTPPDASFSGSGIDSRLRAELEIEANALAAKSRIAFVMPIKQILSAVYRAITDLPRIPDYDPEVAAQQVWRSESVFSLTEVGDEPDEIGVVAREDAGDVRITVNTDSGGRVLDLPLAEAEGFFLAGLAAVAHLRHHRQ